MQQRPHHFFLLGAVALYWLVGFTLAWQLKGLQYDEALLVQGGVHVLNQRTELPLPHDPDTWLCRGAKCVPLMTVRYVGAVKEYAGLPLFALFGSSAMVVRALSILLASLAVYGLGRLVAHLHGWRVGVAAAFALAVHPAFVDQSVFDNGTVAAPFFALGWLFWALARYGESATWRRAFMIGLAAGFGVWARANFTWVLFALVCALHVHLWRWWLAHRREALALVGGLGVGSLPFWIYQAISGGGTFDVFRLFPAEGGWRQRLLSRAVMFAESLVSDREHRAIWGAGAVPAWQAWLFALVLVAALAWCFRRAPRIAIAAGVLYALHFFSTVQVAEHHFVTAIPFAIAVVAAAGGPLRWFAPVYLAMALHWDMAAIHSLRATGGVGQWSDAILAVKQSIEDQHQGRLVNITDWGLQNSLFVLSRGQVRSHEWIGKDPPLAQGGLFLTGGTNTTFFGAPFAARLAGTEHSCEEFRERNGAVFARLCDVEPPGDAAPRVLATAGLHAPEKDGWRWSQRVFEFQVVRSPQWTAFALDLYIPPTVIERLGPVTLTAVGCAPATYRRAGAYRYVRDLPPGATLRAETLRFELDKALRPGPEDGRELGVIVRGLTLR